MPTGNGQPRIYDTALPSDWTPGNTLFTPLLVEELRARVELAGNQVINVDTEGSVLETDLKILLYFPTPLTAPEEAAADNQVLIHNGEAPPPTDTVNEDVTQVAHGLVVGDVIRSEAGLWIKALADTLENSEAQGIVSTVADADNFTFISQGCIRGLTGLVQDTVYFLSDTVAGALTTTEPAISKPMLYAKNDVCGLVYPYRATTGGGGGGGGGSTVFGSEYQYNSSDGESSTTSTLWQTKVSLVTPALPAGTYRIGYTYQPGVDTNSVLGEFRVQRNAVTISQSTFESDNDRHLWGGFFHVATSGVQTITIQYCSPDGYAAAQIRRARLEIWRVA